MSAKGFLTKNLRYLVLVAVIIVLIATFGQMTPTFFSVGTLTNFVRQNAVLYVASVGMMIIMLTGGLDLSVGSTGALAGMIAAMTMRSMGMESSTSGWIGVLIVILVGIVVGTANGLFIGYLKISPFMTTLAMQSITRGMTIAISGNGRIVVDNKMFTWLGKDTIRIPLNKETVFCLPVSFFLIAIVFIYAFIMLRKTSFGRKLYAVGGNPVAAVCSGINARKTTLVAYIANSVLMCIASIVWVGRTMSAVPRQGAGFEFNVLTAVILGGCGLAGGIGTITGTFIGATMLGVITTGLGMIHVPPYVIYWIQGGLIILAVYIDTMSGKVRQRKRDLLAPHHVTHTERQSITDILEKNEQQILELDGISKSFPGVKALDDVSIKFERGKVHAIMGENGAGKSTLMKILTGVYKMDEGEIKINGIPVRIRNPVEAQKFGISIIYQEFALVPFMSVAQNVFLGKEIPSKLGLLISRRRMRKAAREILKRVNLRMDVNEIVQNCRVGQQQMVEIAKAVCANSWVVVMDEPTASLTEDDKEKLFEIIRSLKESGVAVVYISHRMAEIFSIADEVTVLRDGKHVVTAPINEVDEQSLIKHMVGREITDVFTREKADRKDIVLEVRNISRRGVFNPISFTVRAGEVLGFSGLMGAGRTEIMRCLFGLDKADTGEIFVDGEKVDITSPQAALKAGICLVSEDRRREGIIPTLSVRENVAIPSLGTLSKFGFVDSKEEEALAVEYVDKLSIRTPSIEQRIANLSGGNQQKVCLAKWLALNPKVIILDEPTRGVDVGAKAEIHKLIEGLAKAGIAIIIISSELPEIMGTSDRIIILYEGCQTGEFEMDESVTQEMIMKSAAGL